MVVKIAIGGYTFETNTFVSERIDLEAWRKIGIYCERSIISNFEDTRTVIGGFIEASERLSFNLDPIFYAGLGTGGITTKKAFQHLEDNLVEGVIKSGSEGLLLWLHGSMVAENVRDCEGHTLRRIRESMGEDFPIVTILDHHGNVSRDMVENSDVIIGYKTHHDYFERGLEGGKILISIIKRRYKPNVSFKKLPVLSGGGENPEMPPLSKVLFMAYEMEKDERIINASVFPGFPYTDVKRAGMSVVVTSDKELRIAEDSAEKLYGSLWSLRGDFLPKLTSIEEAIDRAMRAEEGPIIFSDKGDNALGGAPGDGTALLKALQDAGWPDAAMVIRDPESVEAAFEAGLGKDVRLSFGGKIDPVFSGEPVVASGEVTYLFNGVWRSESGQIFRIGRTAVIRCGKTEVVLTELISPQIDPQLYRSVNIEPNKKKIVVVKSNWGFRRLFEPLAKEIIDVDTPGATPQGVKSLRSLPWREVPRPIFPLDDI